MLDQGSIKILNIRFCEIGLSISIELRFIVDGEKVQQCLRLPACFVAEHIMNIFYLPDNTSTIDINK